MAGTQPQLRRELNIWETIGISVALMAPSMAANINPQGMVGTVGRAIPLTFVLALVGVLLVSYTFVKLCQKFHHSGSVYGFVGATLGPRAGVAAGWALLGTYTFYGVVTSMACGRIFVAFLDGIGVWKSPPDWAAFLVAALALVLVYLLTVSPVRQGTRTLLTVEVLTVLLIVAVALIVVIRLAAGNAPGGTHLTLTPFAVQPGTGTSDLFLGVVFGFLSFAGFEAAATLGEEARHPRRDIPRAILGTAIFGGIYFVFVTWVEVMGFGADPAGIKAFGNSGSLMGDLGSSFVGSWAGDLISFGASVSAFGCALACAVGASRLLYALSRDGVGPAALSRVSGRQGTPVPASVIVVAGMYLIIAVMALVFRSDSLTVFVNSGVMGTLILLVAYVLATLGVIRLLFLGADRTTPRWQLAVPVLALLVLLYTLWRNVYPYPSTDPSTASFWLPIVCAVWVLLALVVILIRPEVARRAGDRLAAEEGLSAGGSRDATREAV
ncbi:MAG TPA: APC family permease [Kineosporiaceae bacterium]|nr:APC family permease [Kineosporiaceae bacterium]